MLPDSNAKYQIGASIIHVRFCSGITEFRFNINPNTLSADYELWICGAADQFYLIPIKILQWIYEHPNTYPDHHHPEIRVVSIDITTHQLQFATGLGPADFSPYWQDALHDNDKDTFEVVL